MEHMWKILCFPSVTAVGNYAVVVASGAPIVGYCLRYWRQQMGNPNGILLRMVSLTNSVGRGSTEQLREQGITAYFSIGKGE